LREERQFGRGASGNVGTRRTIIRNHFTSLRSKKRKLQSFAIYGGIFLLTISFLIYGNSGSNVSAERSKTLASSETTGVSSASKSAKSKTASVDELTAANAVTNLAETAELPSYVTKEGDTMESIAKKFKISSQTLRWANNTTSDAVEPNKTLVVPLVDGVVYTIKDGDTAQSLAEKYKTSAERVVLYNDIDDGAKLSTGSKIVLPGGELPENERPGYVAPRSRSYGNRYSSSASSTTTSASRSWLTASVGNRYAAGNCTWYAYERRLQLGRPIGSFWGHAKAWSASARAAGLVVNNVPAPGAIIQNVWGGYGYGHVGIVERVDGQNIYVSDMNYAGYNIISSRIVPLAEASRYNFIH